MTKRMCQLRQCKSSNEETECKNHIKGSYYEFYLNNVCMNLNPLFQLNMFVNP